MDKKRILITFLIVLTNTVGATAILPMLPVYVEQQFGATPVQATLVIAAFYAAQFLAAPWLGVQSDRLGRRPILIVSQLGTIASYLLFIFAGSLGRTIGVLPGLSGGLLLIYLARIIDGLTGGNVSVAEAYASDISSEESRAHALALVGGANGIGHILGPVLGVILSGAGLVMPMIGALGMSALTLILTVIFLSEPTHHRAVVKPSERRGPSLLISHNHSTLSILAVAFSTGLYVAVLFSSLSLYAERVLFVDWQPEHIVQYVNLMVVVVGVATALSQIFLIAPMVHHLGEKQLVVLGSFLLLLSALGFIVGTLPIVIISLLLYALGFAISWPSQQSIVTRMTLGEASGRVLGFVQSAFSLAFVVAPLAAGLILQGSGASIIFYVCAGLMGLATLISLRVLKLPLASPPVQAPSEAAGGLFAGFHH